MIINRNILDKIFSREYFMYIVVLQCFFKNINFFPYGKYFIYFVCAYAFLVLAYRLLFDRNMIFHKGIILGSLLTASVLLSVIANRFIGKYDNIVIFLIFIIMFFIISNFNCDEPYQKVEIEIVKVMRFTSIVYFIYSICSLLFSISTNNFRVSGLMQRSDFYSYTCLTIIGCNIFLVLYDKVHAFVRFSFINLIFHTLILLFTQARATYLAFIISFLFFLIIMFNSYYIDRNKYSKSTIISLFAILIIAIFAIVFLLDRYTSLKFNLVLERLLNYNLNGRELIWPFALRVFRNNNLFFGLSYGGVPIVWKEFLNNNPIDFVGYDKDIFNFILSEGMAHSIYLQQLCSNGLIGLILLLIYFIKIVVSYVRVLLNKVKDDFSIAILSASSFAVLGQLIIGFFNNNIIFNIVYISQIHFFYFSGCLLYINERNLRKLK